MKNNQFFKHLLLALVVSITSLMSTDAYGQTLRMSNYGNSVDEDAIIQNTPYTSITVVDNEFRLDRLPTTVAGFGTDVDLVYIGAFGNYHVTQEQADALVQFVTDGGVLISNLEEIEIRDPRNGIRPSYLGSFLATNLNCGDSDKCLDINTMPEGGTLGYVDPYGSNNVNTPYPYHSGEGNLLLTDGINELVNDPFVFSNNLSSSSICWFVGVPPENAIILANPSQGIASGNNPNSISCSANAVLDLVVPAYPGTANDCGVTGMALLSGDYSGILSDHPSSDRLTGKYFAQLNANYAQLIYDFLNRDVDATAMNARNAWSSDPANVSTVCGIDGDPVTATGAGTIDCSKTQIATAPVAGEAGQKTLMVTINVTTAGTISPIAITGSGMTIANSITEIVTATTGTQTFSIAVDYDGAALGTANFTIGTETCTADLTTTPKDAITPIYTLDCVPLAGPGLQ